MLWAACRFLFPEWALHLNELSPELIAKLPPTDDRLRPDMRLMEHGYYTAVSALPLFKQLSVFISATFSHTVLCCAPINI